ncbi:NADAR family protein [Fluoribacter dumoffii]|uniref:NADAR family protein n=1 Tax=Fluoribacter dumoffii TaxID=463 RepID=UPI00224463B4|nr:NADAR family protein [Fluoribacter dumoffii]MCW8384743.1 NADAR family protein [Fluoribacter dumoffii]MCW8496857.1 NADAR family protein [Fluoribacter dumoffii]
MPLTARSYKGAIKKLSGPSNHLQGRPDSVDIVAFDREGAEWGIFSNYAEIPIEMQTPYGKRTFPTVEHYFQYQKDPQDKKYLDKILAGDAQNARDLGQSKKWADFRLADEAMQRAIQEKLKKPKVQDALRDTGNACLIEDTGSRANNQDGNWGWKKGGTIDSFAKTGNKLGILWMEERNRLYQQDGNYSMIVKNPAEVSERARGVMTKNYGNTDLISLSARLPNAANSPKNTPKNDSFPSSRVKSSLKGLTQGQTGQESSAEVSAVIRTMMTAKAPSSIELPMVSKGQMNGTFKIAFDNPADAAAFKGLLQKQGFETSYFGNGERYPMQHGGKTLNHIVRFENKGSSSEIPKEALEFLKQKFNDDDKVASIVEQMGFERPAPKQSMHR